MTLTISCPNCSSRYLLPEHLLGPAGARVCCPACWHRFTVDSAGTVVPLEVEPLYSPPPAVPGAESGRPDRAAAGPEEAVAPASAASASAAAESAAPRPSAEEAARSLAHEALSDLDSFTPELVRAAARGRLFAEFGPRVLDAFDRYRHAADPAAGEGPFRRALRERWNVDLPAADAAEAALGQP